MQDKATCPGGDNAGQRIGGQQDAAAADALAPNAGTPAPQAVTMRAVAVAVERFADCGPGQWWFVHHPEGYLLEIGPQQKAEKLAAEINAGREALSRE